MNETVTFMDVYKARYSGKKDESLVYSVQYLKEKHNSFVFALFRGAGCSTHMTGITEKGEKIPFYVTSDYKNIFSRVLVCENDEWFIFEDGKKQIGEFPDIVLNFFAKEGIVYGTIPPSCWAMALGKMNIKLKCQEAKKESV